MDNRPPIAYITSHYARASDTFIRGEVAQLRKRGWTVHTFSVRRSDEKGLADDVLAEQARTDFILEQGVLLLLLATLAMLVRRPGGWLGALALAWRTRTPGLRSLLWQVFYFVEACYLAGRLIDKRIALIHNHIPANSAWVTMLASRMSGVPYSMTVHGPTVFQMPEQWRLATKIERSAFTACISDFCRSQCMLFSNPSAWGRLKIVRCGLDEQFLGVAPTPVPDVKRLVFVGRLCADKGPLVLLEAAARLAAEGLKFNIEFIGDGPMRPAMEAAIARQGLSGHVHLLGWRTSAQVRERLIDSRGLVLPSFAEGLPVVMMESLALHRPVVATQIAGVPELVRHGESGWLVPAGSVDLLADAMRQAFVATPQVLSEMGAAGAAVVARRHDAAAEAAVLEGCIMNALGLVADINAVDPVATAGGPAGCRTLSEGGSSCAV